MLDLKQVEAVFTIIWPQQDWNGGDEGFCRAVAEKVVRTLQAVGPEQAVAVKPLTWNEGSFAHTDVGILYRVIQRPDFWLLEKITGSSTFKSAHPSEKAAKAAAQADYASRIRSALVATPPAAMTCDEQFALATKLAGDLGYDLVPEPPHPDTPVDNFSGQTIPPAERVVEAQVKHMVKRFLQWELPKDFRPDGGISFDPIGNKGTKAEFERNPHGTNLLNHTQATAMVRQIMSGIPGLVAEPATKTLPYDLFTHRDAWRKALEAARDTAEISSPDIDDRSYWQHELDVFDRVFAALAAKDGRS